MDSVFKIEVVKSEETGQFFSRIRCVNNGEIIFSSEQRPSKSGLNDTLQNFVSFMHNNVCPIVDTTVQVN